MSEQSFDQLVERLHVALSRDILSSSISELSYRDAILDELQRKVRSRINALAPISMLPPELLIPIFQSVASHDLYGPWIPLSKRDFKWDDRSRIGLTHVCRTWRNVALNIPELWTHVDITNIDRFETIVARAQNLPISLYVRTADGYNMNKLLESYIARLQRLDIRVDRPFVGLPRLLGHRAPLLRCLTITSDRGNLSSTTAEILDPKPILFEDRVSTLRGIALMDIDAWVPGNYFPDLTHLYLSFVASQEDDADTQLLSLLANTPRLEVLQVVEVYQEVAITPFVPEDRVVLSSLRSVAFSDVPLPFALPVLARLDIPRTTLVRIDDLEPFGDSLAEIPPGLVDGLTQWELFTKGEYLHSILEDRDASSGIWIRSKCERDDNWTIWLSQLGTIYSFPLASITTLHVCVSGSAIILPSLLPQMSRLEELAVLINPALCEGEEPRRLLREMCASLTWLEEDICCPRLRMLGIQSDTLNPADVAFRAIIDMAVTRALLEHRLERFAIQPRRSPDCERGTMPENIARAFREAFAPLKQHVGTLEVMMEGNVNQLCPFEMKEFWDVPDAEKYWTLSNDERPKYDLPWK